ncbi:MAG: lipopolysaccharide kinase InaA family protein, partial [Nitrosomonadales bacterium]|nr:lipopolysaccharide kinase InaA family protein [Nitrosomonadales bacterium]
RAAALTDIYSEADISQAQCISRDGEILPVAPDFVTESPVYLCWSKNRQVTVNMQARLIDDLAIDAHIGKSHYSYRQGDWRGMILAENTAEADLLRFALNPVNIAAPAKTAVLRKARNAIWTIADPRDPARKLVIKQPVRMHLHKKLLDRFKPSKGLRSWNGASELLRRGVETARPVAYFEKAGDKTLTQNYYICEFVEADFSARDIFSAFAQGETEYQGISPENIYKELAAYLLIMHGRGVFFRDLSGGNILVKKTADGKLSFSLIDTGRAHFYLRGTDLSKRISDLTRICNKLHAEGRDRFMQIYMSALGKEFGAWYRLPFHLYNAKVSMKRQFKTIKKMFRR